jgi:diguanylate cyclase (GGDEF)-like protein
MQDNTQAHRAPLSLTRLVLVLFSASALVTVALLLTASVWLKRAAVEDLATSHAREFADLAFGNLYLVMRQGGGREDIENAINELRKNKQDHLIRVIRGDPVIRQFGSRDDDSAIWLDPLVRQALEQRAIGLSISEESIRYVYPIKVEQQCLSCHHAAQLGDINGVIDITHPVDHLSVPLDPMLKVMIGFSVFFLGILLLAVHVNLRHFVVRPLSAMAGVMKDIIGDADLSRRVQHKSQVREISGLSDSFNHLLGAVEDYNRQLEELSSNDPLTKLNNRWKFEQSVNAQIQFAGRDGTQFSILVFDLDHFGYINDVHGHPMGDLVLKEVANVLRNSVRSQDIVARIGEDEFGVILPDTAPQKAQVMADALCRDIAGMEFQTTKGPLRVTASMGVVVYPIHGHTSDSLLITGDVAISKAKTLGRNRAVAVDSSEVEDVTRIHGRDVWLRKAIADERVILYAQPIVNVRANRMFACEVLTRIQDGDRLLSADHFVPDLERHGGIEDLDRFVLEQALDQKHRIPSLEGVKLFVNLSAVTIENHEFMESLPTLLRAHHTPPGEVVIEITEREALRQLSKLSSLIRDLREEDILFALDDFGSGFNSFLYLKYFPVDFVKIEGSFVQQIAHNRRDRLIVEHIHQVAQALGVKTIAERVEDVNTHDLVRALSIELAQGYYYEAPTPLQDVGHSPFFTAAAPSRLSRTGTDNGRF